MHEILQDMGNKERGNRFVVLLNIQFIGGNEEILTLAPCTPTSFSSSNVKEPTVFKRVHGTYRRRPATISLNVQWVPVNDHSGIYQWSGNNEIGRGKVKTVTFFGTGEMRGRIDSNAITPPNSKYTDDYLSAFSSKSPPTGHINQRSTSVLVNSTPIRLKPMHLPASTSTSVQASSDRFININNMPVAVNDRLKLIIY